MLWFPQLETGANGQFPVRRKIMRRTVLTEQMDGSVVKLAGLEPTVLEWTLDFEGLAASEVVALEALFTACEGRLGTFVFLDPFDNLLRWSEDLNAAAWVRQGGEIRQTIQAPAACEYCFSVDGRSDGLAEADLIVRAGAVQWAKRIALAPEWRRFEHTVKLASTEETVTFAMASSAADVKWARPQVDAQRGPSCYKPTTSHCGVHVARFADDVLSLTADGPDSHFCRVRVRARMGD